MARTITGLQPPSPHETGTVVNLLLQPETPSGGPDGVWPEWLYLDPITKQLTITADAPPGEYGPFTIEGADLLDGDGPDWVGADVYEVPPGTSLPYAALFEDRGSYQVLRNADAQPEFSEKEYHASSENHGIFGYWNPATTRMTNFIIKGNSTTHPSITVPSPGEVGSATNRFPGTDDVPLPAGHAQFPPYQDHPEGGAVAYPFFNLKSDYFWIDEIGTRNDAGENNGCFFVNTVPCAYPLYMSILDNHFQNPAKWVKSHRVMGTLPPGFSYSEYWGELIYDGTKQTADVDEWFAYQVTDARGVTQEQVFRLVVKTPTLVYGPTGTHYAQGGFGEEILETDTSITEFVKLCKLEVGNRAAGDGNPVIFAFQPQVIDCSRQAEVAESEGHTIGPGATGQYGLWRELPGCSEHHFVSYTGEEIDRTLAENRVSIAFVNSPGEPDLRHPGSYFTGVIPESGRTNSIKDRPSNKPNQIARIKFSQRECIVGVNGRGVDYSNKTYKHILLQHCSFNRGYSVPMKSSDIGFSRAYVQFISNPTHSTVRDVEVFGGGDQSYAHLMYNHGGDYGRANYDGLRMYENGGNAGNMIKAYSGQQYFRDCYFSSLKNVEDINTTWEDYKDVSSTGTVVAYTGDEITLSNLIDDPTKKYIRITSGPGAGSAWRWVSNFTKQGVATLDPPIYPEGSTWPNIEPGASYEIYTVHNRYTGGPCINAGAGGLLVVDRCKFKTFSFAMPGKSNSGGNFVFDTAARREWAGCLFPYYGTKEYMDPQWWDDFTNLHGGAGNPENPYSHKIYLRDSEFIKYKPTHPALTHNSRVCLALRGYYPDTVQWFPDVPQGSPKTGFEWVPLTNPVDENGKAVPGAPQAWSSPVGMFISNTTFEGFEQSEIMNATRQIKTKSSVSRYSNWDKEFWADYYDNVSSDFPEVPYSFVDGDEEWQR